MLKVLTRMEEADFTEAFSRMFNAGWHCVKRLHPINVSSKLRVECFPTVQNFDVLLCE